MSGWLDYFGGRRNSKTAMRDAIVALRTQASTLERKEEHLQQQVDGEMSKARTNVSSNKAVATAALRKKKLLETEMDRVGGMRLALEKQAIDLESANLNRETMLTMEKASKALKSIHGNLTVETVDKVMEDLADQHLIAEQISQAISNADGIGSDIDMTELEEELKQIETEEMDRILQGFEDETPRVPVNKLAGLPVPHDDLAEEEEKERKELEQLQAELAMA
ncbi:late endosome to vacuole transport-related protein [Auriculariales sp. MPI-PUGE-AT-0066]|nr:late endosome to vacuole transport-related protein [Auriculariales sp. MPI-PUGE-AT-0066]